MAMTVQNIGNLPYLYKWYNFRIIFSPIVHFLGGKSQLLHSYCWGLAIVGALVVAVGTSESQLNRVV